MYNQKYKFYSAGIFGLIDSYHRDIWFVLSNNQEAISIKNVFVSKISLLAINLTSYSNFVLSENTVDSEVGLNWQVPATDDYAMAVPTLLNPDLYNDIVTAYSSGQQLINKPVTTNLDIDQKLQLQDQIYLYSTIYKLFDTEWQNNNQQFEKVFASIETVFREEINLSAIEDRLYNLALDIMPDMLSMSSKIIRIIGRDLYE